MMVLGVEEEDGEEDEEEEELEEELEEEQDEVKEVEKDKEEKEEPVTAEEDNPSDEEAAAAPAADSPQEPAPAQYFGMLRKTRKSYRRTPKALGPTLEQQIVDHVDPVDPHEYYIVKERKPRSTPKTRRKRECPGRCRGVGRRRMIIDIHLEVLNECQKSDLHSTKENFFEILVQEFMGSDFIKEENVLNECVPKEQVPGSDSGFREERLSS
ncbi:SICA antigen [Plasmodium coatneyi]|uniref:SICA antigen n=1 Tax=Plasmodium coatneyi TaxID=208452 RepID=A0A1B1DVP5_9APIC|nr:SICA antigen [Plasmodium coatneyi]ANQ06861.1 SICA antigen [Plasmodium coatneyi]